MRAVLAHFAAVGDRPRIPRRHAARRPGCCANCARLAFGRDPARGARRLSGFAVAALVLAPIRPQNSGRSACSTAGPPAHRTDAVSRADHELESRRRLHVAAFGQRFRRYRLAGLSRGRGAVPRLAALAGEGPASRPLAFGCLIGGALGNAHRPRHPRRGRRFPLFPHARSGPARSPIMFSTLRTPRYLQAPCLLLYESFVGESCDLPALPRIRQEATLAADQIIKLRRNSRGLCMARNGIGVLIAAPLCAAALLSAPARAGAAFALRRASRSRQRPNRPIDQPPGAAKPARPKHQACPARHAHARTPAEAPAPRASPATPAPLPPVVVRTARA